jgi:hypothetical protein
MRKTKNFTFMIVFVIFVMFVSLTNVSPVLADDGTPPEPPPAEVTDEPTEPPAEATEVPVEATSVPEEPTESVVVATEAPVEEAVTDTAVARSHWLHKRHPILYWILTQCGVPSEHFPEILNVLQTLPVSGRS